MKQKMALGAAVLALGAGSAALVQKATAGGAVAVRQDAGGLSLMPAVLETNAKTGTLATVTVANRSAAAMTVTLTPRQWVQGADGKVSPNRKGALGGVSVTEGSFTLAPGGEKQVTVNVSALGPGGSLYGALEAVGLPTDLAKRKGLVLGYRVVGAIRLNPTAPKSAITAGTIKASKGAAVLPVKNTGNTIDAVTGSVSVRDARGTRNLSVQGVKILPGKTVNIPLGTKLQKGSATAKITLNQNGKRAVQLSKKFTVK